MINDEKIKIFKISDETDKRLKILKAFNEDKNVGQTLKFLLDFYESYSGFSLSISKKK